MLLHGLNVNIMAKKVLSGVYFVCGTAAISGQQHVGDIYFFIELKHLQHLFTVLQLMSQFLGPDHLTLENAAVHFKLHLGFLKSLPFEIVLSLFLQHAIPFLSESPGCLSYFRSPLFELLFVGLQQHYLLVEAVPVRCEEFALLLEEPPLLPEFALPLSNDLSPLL